MNNGLLDAPKVKRTHCYVQQPNQYDIFCPICKSPDIAWSEFEKHIWCYKCEKDVLLTWNNAGIFSGPIPVNAAKILGISFDRIGIESLDIVEFGSDSLNDTWVRDAGLSEYIENIEK